MEIEMELYSCCIFCYKKYREEPEPDHHHHDKLLSGEERMLLKRFFDLFERYVEMEIEGGGKGDSSSKNSKSSNNNNSSAFMEKLINDGLVGACVECFQIIEAFCSLFNDLKSIELLLKWKVWELQNVMDGSRRFPSRVETFKQIFNQGEAKSNWNNKNEATGSSSADAFKLTVDFKRRLMSNCIQKVVFSYPKLRMRKCPALSQIAEKSETIIPTSHRSPTPTETTSPTITRIIKKRKRGKGKNLNFLGVGDLADGELQCKVCGLSFFTKLELEGHLLLKECYMPPSSSSSPPLPISQTQAQERNVTTAPGEETADSNDEVFLENFKRPTAAAVEEGEGEEKETDATLQNQNSPFFAFLTERKKSIKNRATATFSCSICNKIFTSSNARRIHMEGVHEGIRYRCNYCKISCTQKSSAMLHFKTFHAPYSVSPSASGSRSLEGLLPFTKVLPNETIEVTTESECNAALEDFVGVSQSQSALELEDEDGTLPAAAASFCDPVSTSTVEEETMETEMEPDVDVDQFDLEEAFYDAARTVYNK